MLPTVDSKQNLPPIRVVAVDAGRSPTHGHASMQGKRPSMEDAVVAFDGIDLFGPSVWTAEIWTAEIAAALPAIAVAVCGIVFDYAYAKLTVVPPISFYGVFDGHNGGGAAKYSRDWIVRHTISELEAGRTADAALRVAFRRTDDDFLRLTEQQLKTTDEDDDSGTTAVVLLIDATGRYVCANAGDSRCILIGTDRKMAATALSEDHKPNRPDEEKRIRAVGGMVWNKRLAGVLAVSRAIGDRSLKLPSTIPYGPAYSVNDTGIPKQSGLISEPEIRTGRLTTGDACIVLGCDGLFDVLSNPQVAKWTAIGLDLDKSLSGRADTDHLAELDVSGLPASIQSAIVGPAERRAEFIVKSAAGLSKPTTLNSAAEHLVRFAIDECWSTDNVSVVVVRLPVGLSTSVNTKRKQESVTANASTPVLSGSPDDVSSTATTEPLDLPVSPLPPHKRLKASFVAAAASKN